MADTQLATFLRRLRRTLRPSTTDGASDAQLLLRFVQQRDEEAFELLIWRHGLMVLNVCRRVLRHEHDAEDAFQATFLALARKAGSIGKRDSVGSWLYKVAYRIALRAQNAVPLQSLSQGSLPESSSREPIHDLLDRELSSAVDEEIQRLPEKYRVALVLCHLEGKTIESAARCLDCPPATVGTRLARARTLLRRRLVRRGFDVSDATEARNIVFVLSATLVSSTVQAAVLGTAEQAVAAGMISTSAAAMTKGALQAMSLTRWTATTALVLSLCLFGGGGALIAYRVAAVEPAQLEPVPPDAQDSSARANKSAAVSFRWKFQQGQPFYQIITNRTTQNLNVMDNDVSPKQEQTFYLQWTPLEKKGGKWTLEMKILGIKMDIDIGGSPIHYDSTAAKNAPNPLADAFKSLNGAGFQLILGKHSVNRVRREFGRGRAHVLPDRRRGMTAPADP